MALAAMAMSAAMVMIARTDASPSASPFAAPHSHASDWMASWRRLRRSLQSDAPGPWRGERGVRSDISLECIEVGADDGARAIVAEGGEAVAAGSEEGVGDHA